MDRIFATTHKLADAIKNMQTSLQCMICQHTISEPVKTPCGHRYCRTCIQTVLQNKNASCPLCKAAIQRRSITADEDMKVYIDRLQKLIEAIQMDSGIDISSHLDRPLTVQESPTDFNHDPEESKNPGCSNVVALKERDDLPSTPRKKKEKNNLRNPGESDIRDYLTKYSMSGVEPLSGNTNDQDEDENDKNSKVHSWLNTLPNSEALVHPDKIVSEELTECNLDDTLTVSVSQNCKNNKPDDYEAEVHQSPLRVSPNNEKGNETGSDGSKTVLIEDPANPRPSTSGMSRPSEEYKERSNDVQRTSPCDMLPAMKKNWSSVARFGKEMRTKKKKLKSLNVNKSRYEETAEEETSRAKGAKNKSSKRRENDSNVSLGILKLARDRPVSKEKDSWRCESRKDPEASTNIAESIDDPRNLEKSLTNARERRKSVERTERRSSLQRRNLVDGLQRTEDGGLAENSDEVQIIGESSFIELEKGEQVRIKKLNNCQMNDIIGVMKNYGDHSSTTNENDAADNRDQMDSSLPLKKRRNLSSTPPCDRSRQSDQTTPTKLSVDKRDQSLCDTVNESASKCQSAKSRGRLSLARRSVEPKSNDSSGPNSRLQAAKRDLNREIDASIDVRNDVAAAKASRDKDETRENVRRTVRSVSKMEDKEDVSMVKFKKLGKVFRHRKKRVRFLYLGSTRPKKSDGSNYPEIKPCNLVDYVETQCFTMSDNLENAFGNNLLITVNDSTPVDEDVGVQKAPLAKAKDESEDVMCLDIERKEVKETAISMDVVFVSLNEDEKQREAAKASENTVPNSPVHLMSPTNVSRLKNQSFESPTNRATKTSKYSHVESVIISDQRKDFEVKGAHSRALIRRSQQASASSDTDSTCDSATKRKRPKDTGWIDKNIQRMRKMSLVSEAGYESDHSFSSRTTCIRNSDKGTSSSKDENVPLSKTSTRCVDTMSVSSGSDVEIGRNAGRQKKTFRRIMLVSSDTDSPNLVSLNKDLQSPPPKRKRITPPDSDCEVELEALMKDWCEDPNMDRSKNKLKQPAVKPDRQEAASCSFHFNGAKSQPRQVSKTASNLEERNRVQAEQDSPDFAATIDRIQNIRKSTMASQNKESLQKVDPEEVMMIDNLNDVMDFDTNAFDEYLEAQGIKPANKVDPGSSSYRPSNKDVMLAHRSNSSDKENKYKDGRLPQIDSDNEVTFVDDFDQADKRIEGVKPPADRSKSEADKSSTRNAMTSDNQKRADGLHDRADDDVLMKDVDYEQDSLMNITQHYLLIKQFENDLFGKPLCSNDSFEFKGQKTPQKTGNKNKDNEHSAEEDDIVENTPDTKTKKIHLNSTCRENLGASSIVNDRHLRTPSSITGRSTLASTPCSKKSLHPLYQSTPKSQQSPKIRTSSTKATKNESVRHLRDLGMTNNCNKQRLCFVCSGLIAAQVNEVKRLAQLVNARYLTQFNEQVTHVIVKVDEENNGANKTLKYLQGIAHRKWIVGYQWVIDSLKEKKLVDEERYEAVDCGTLEAGPRNSRLRKKNLFDGFVFLCIGPYVDVSVDQYRDLLRATGAKVVDSLDALTVEKSKLKIIVIQSDVHDYEIIEWYQKARAVPIVHDWVVECISQYRLISFYPYLQELSRQDVLALGYPEFLVEEDLAGDSDSACNASV